MRKASCIILVFLLLSISVFAQFKKHEFTVWNGVGMGTLHPHLKIKENKFQFVENFGGDYCFSFTEHWGIGAGVEFSYYNSSMLRVRHFVYQETRDVYRVEYNYIEGNEYNRVDINRDVPFISIPLFVRFQTGKTNQFLMSFGGRMAIPLSGSHCFTEHIGYEETVPLHPNDSHTIFMRETTMLSNTEYKLGFLLSAECGAKWRLNTLLSAHTLLYVDYGLNDIRKMRATFDYEGIKMNDIGKVSPMQIGIKVKLGFNK